MKTADAVTAHTLLNCLIREVSAPEHQVTVDDGHLLLRLPRRGLLLRSRLRRISLIGAHRFQDQVQRLDNDAWVTVSWKELAGYIQGELELRTGVANEEFLTQVADSRETIRTALEERAGGTPHADPYVASEQSLVFGHRFHLTPKARTGDPADWLAYGPETGSRFRLRYLAVSHHLVREEGELHEMDALHPTADPGFAMLPVHPWQYRMLQGHDRLCEAMAAGDVVDTGVSGPELVPTASVRTLYHPDSDTFLKFSLNVRLTNCIRRHASYELPGSLALNRLLQPLFTELAGRFPGCALLAEPGYRTLDAGDTALLEGLGVIVRSGLRHHLRPGVTPLLAAAVADEYPTSTAHVSHLLARGDGNVLAWWDTYLSLLLPPVLAAYFEHGVVLEPHLQNVVVGVQAWADDWAHEPRVDLAEVNVGGGMGVDYAHPRNVFDWSAFGAGLRRILDRHPHLTPRIEPGRSITAYCGWYVTQVLDVKFSRGDAFAVLRGGTHHLRTPAAKQHDQPFEVIPDEVWLRPWDRPGTRDEPVTLVGQLCTPKDVLARRVMVERLRVGDRVAFAMAGACSWNISHHSFLMHPHPTFHHIDDVEVSVTGDSYAHQMS